MLPWTRVEGIRSAVSSSGMVKMTCNLLLVTGFLTQAPSPLCSTGPHASLADTALFYFEDASNTPVYMLGLVSDARWRETGFISRDADNVLCYDDTDSTAVDTLHTCMTSEWAFTRRGHYI